MHNGKEVKTVYMSESMGGADYAKITYVDGSVDKPDVPQMKKFVEEHGFQRISYETDDACMDGVITDIRATYGPPRDGYDRFGNKIEGVSADSKSAEWTAFLANESLKP